MLVSYRGKNSRFSFAQLDLVALGLKPYALGQSCFSRLTYANQLLSVTPMESLVQARGTT